MMQAATKTYLHFVMFSDLINWSVQYMLDTKFSYADKYELVEIGTFLKRNKTAIEIEDDEEYKRVTIKINNGGVFLRDIERGINIGTKKQFIVSEGQFLLSKIDARNGAFGVVSKEVNGAIITGNFWTFDVDYSKINPHFLSLITTTPEFIKFSENASNGTTNRHYLQEELFLAQKIPLPSLEEQKQIVENYNANIRQAEVLEQQANDLEKEIESYLFDVLGIESEEKKPFVKGVLNFVPFSSFIDRWDLYKLTSAISKTSYPIKTLGEVLNFVSRSWKKSQHNSEEFEYIELSSINSLQNISETIIVRVDKAPSRATQIVNKGDLIIGTTRPYLKKFAIVDEKHNANIASSGFQVIAPSSNYNISFVLEFLLSNSAVKQFELFMTGALYPAITNKDLKRVQIPFPPLNIQEEIANHIQTIRMEIKNLRHNAEESRKKAIKEFEQKIFE